jgi:putative hydrolase of the HAD superfamily
MNPGRPAPRALLVDLDDTILDYSGGVDDSWRQACAAAAPAGLDVERLTAVVAQTRRWFWDDPERHRRERVDMPGAWRKIAALALERLGAPDPGLAQAIAGDFAARRRVAQALFPGARETLEALRARGLGLGLVTNGDARQQRDKIQRFDLARLFDVIVIEGEFGAGKPDPAVYRHALGGLGVPPREAWMVGDNLEWDVAAPQALGLGGAWVDREGRGLPASARVAPDRIVSALADLGDLA